MNTIVTYVSKNSNLPTVKEELSKATVLGVDTETTGLDPLTSKVRLLQIATMDRVFLFDLFELSLNAVKEEILPFLLDKKKVKVFHNAKFDLKMLRTTFGLRMGDITPMFDTYIADKLVRGGSSFTSSLDNVAEDLLKVRLDKSYQKFDWSGSLYKEVLTYAALDAAVLLPLYRVLAKSIRDNKLMRVAKLEFDAVPAMAQLELNGIGLDKDIWIGLAQEGKNRLKELGDRMFEIYGDINYDSHPQMKKALMQLTGLPVESTKESAIDDLLLSYQETKNLFGDTMDYRPALILLKEYREESKRQTAFGAKFLQFVHKKTGRIHPNYMQIETKTGRMSCFTGDAPIRTVDGVRPMISIKPGDLVWTHKSRWRPVTAFLDQGIRPVYRVTLCTGDQVTCTRDHLLLCSDGEWRPLEEVAYGLFKNLDTEYREPTEGTGVIPIAQLADNQTSSGSIRDVLPQRHDGTPAGVTGKRTQGHEGGEAVGRQDGVKEPDVREDGGTAPQLGWAERGWAWVPDHSLERQEGLCPSRSDAGAPRVEPTAGRNGNTPHRWGQAEQRPRQSSSGDNEGAQVYTLYAGEGQPLRAVKEVHYIGSAQVYDISVEEDESFSVAGVFAHNCREPNLQQIPRDSTMRSAFVAGEGMVMWNSDYSQIELRGLAQFTKDRLFMEAFQNNVDIHSKMAAEMFKVSTDKVTSEQRHAAKTINFGVPYGMGAPRLALLLRIGVDEAKRMLKSYYDSHPDMVEWFRKQEDYFKDHDCVRSAAGRLRALSNWRYDEWNAIQASKNFPIQATSADITKRAMARCYEELPEEVKLVHVVHDELVHELPDNEQAEEIGRTIDTIMRESAEEFLPDVPILVEGKLAGSWQK